jgi:hypothetical protein
LDSKQTKQTNHIDIGMIAVAVKVGGKIVVLVSMELNERGQMASESM